MTDKFVPVGKTAELMTLLYKNHLAAKAYSDAYEACQWHAGNVDEQAVEDAIRYQYTPDSLEQHDIEMARLNEVVDEKRVALVDSALQLSTWFKAVALDHHATKPTLK